MSDHLMAYDALHEVCTRISGHYVMRANQAKTRQEHDHWIQQTAQLRQEAWEISPEDHAAVETKRAEWRLLLQSLAEQTPDVKRTKK